MRQANTRLGTLDNIIATREKTSWPHIINLSRKAHNFIEMEDWCREKCSGLWRSHSSFSIYFQFELQQDAMMFALRWGSV